MISCRLCSSLNIYSSFEDVQAPILVKFQVISAVNVKNTEFHKVMLCRTVKIYQNCGYHSIYIKNNEFSYPINMQEEVFSQTVVSRHGILCY
jgi:hypothetical protein